VNAVHRGAPSAFIVTTMARALFCLALACLPLLAAAQQSLEVISLRHRTADQVIGTLRSLVEPGGSLTGQGNQLILRVSPANLAEIRQALDVIDRPQRRLQISVRFDDAFDASRRELGASGTVGNQGSRIELRGQDFRASGAERVDQRVLAMDGGRATIFTGQSRPVLQGQFPQDTVTGFEVVPRVIGERVTVEVFATRASLTSASTIASGRLGEWLELGGVAASAARDVWVKVDTLD